MRQQSGIGFTGDSYEQSFVLADIKMDWPLAVNEVSLFFSPDGLVVVAPLPGGRHRVVATVNTAPEHSELADVQKLLDARGPAAQPGVSRLAGRCTSRGLSGDEPSRPAWCA